MRFFLIIAILCYSCTEKKQTRLESNIDSNLVEIDKDTFDGGFSKLGETSRLVVYDSASSMYCMHKNLSTQFDMEVYLNRYISTGEHHDSSTVKLVLRDKKSKMAFDSIQLHSHFYYNVLFKDCKDVRSYSTKFNEHNIALDNYYGDIIVADLNFDTREDIALINDMGGNAGSLYSFFIQNKDRKFIKDEYLTDSMQFFPSKIDTINEKLTTYIHAGVCGLGEHIYVFKDACWKQESHNIINICND